MVHPVAEADERSPFGRLTPEEFYARHGVSHSTSTFVNPRGLRIFTQRWTPVSGPILGAVAVVHGFTGESSWTVQLTAVHLAASGFAVAAVDHQGHGFSEGLQGHIPDITPVLDDCDAAFAPFRAAYPPPLRCFLYGESLGGAIALLLHLRGKEQGLWRDGAVLNGAMCGVSPRFKPPWPLEHLLSLAAAVAPTWRVAFTRGNIPERSFKVDWKRRLALASPRRSTAPPRAATARELLRVCRDLQARFEEVELPLLVVHGADDTVCDPACVQELHRRAGSRDKTIRVYPGMWHQIVGEPEENVEMVFDEIVAWLKARAGRPSDDADAVGEQQEKQ